MKKLHQSVKNRAFLAQAMLKVMNHTAYGKIMKTHEIMPAGNLEINNFFHYIIVKETLNRKCQIFSLCTPTGNSYFPPISIFFNNFLYLYYQIVGLPKSCQKFFLT